MTNLDSLPRCAEVFEPDSEKCLKTMQDFLSFFERIAKGDESSNFTNEANLISFNINLDQSFSDQILRFRNVLESAEKSGSIAGFESLNDGPVASSHKVIEHKNGARIIRSDGKTFYRYNVRIFLKNSTQPIQEETREDTLSVIKGGKQ